MLGRAEQTCAGLREQLRLAAAQSKGLQAQLSESHRKHAEAQCKVGHPGGLGDTRGDLGRLGDAQGYLGTLGDAWGRSGAPTHPLPWGPISISHGVTR